MNNSVHFLDKFLLYLRHELGRAELTLTAYCRDIYQFAVFITDNHPEIFDPLSISSSDIRLWIVSLASDAHEAPSSLRRKIQSLRAFFRYLCRVRYRSDNPTNGIILPKLPSHLPEFVKISEMEDMLTEDAPENKENPSIIDFRNHLILELLYTTGMRRAELYGLSDSAVNHYRSEIRVLGKRSKPRIIPLHPEMIKKIANWQMLRDSTWETLDDDQPLFITSRGHRLSVSAIELIVKKGLANVSSGRKSPHTLRHTFATAMLNGGAGINNVKELLGHASLSTTQIYTHVSFAEINDAYNRAHPRSKEKNKQK